VSRMAFEAILQQRAPASARWRRITLTVSLALHGAAVAAGIAYSLWRVEELPLPTVAVTLTSGLPPPPPPPAARKRSTSTPKTKPTPTQPTTIVQPQERPIEKPKDEPKEPDDDSGQVGGVVGGVKGGVQGGIVGGVVGAPASNAGPRMVSPQVARGQLLIDPNDERYRVSLPPPLARAGMRFFAILRVCVGADGAVTGVRILRGADPAIDPQIPTVLGRWRYRPFTVDGRPTPFCYMLRYEITSR
jgi:protein TonB